MILVINSILEVAKEMAIDSMTKDDVNNVVCVGLLNLNHPSMNHNLKQTSHNQNHKLRHHHRPNWNHWIFVIFQLKLDHAKQIKLSGIMIQSVNTVMPLFMEVVKETPTGSTVKNNVNDNVESSVDKVSFNLHVII